VSARGRNSNAGPAGLASFAAWNRRERGKWPRRSQRSAIAGRKVLKASVVGPPSMASPLGADDAQGASSFLASGAKEGTGAMVKPWAAPLSTTKHQGRQASGTTGAQGAAVKITTQRACVSVRDARRAASWTGLMQFHCGAGNAPLQSRKLPISVPRAASARIYRGLDMASFYLWFRSDEHGGSAGLLPCHPSSNGVCGKASGSDARSGPWYCAVTPITAQYHWRSSAAR
jgi:hypothetical protein